MRYHNKPLSSEQRKLILETAEADLQQIGDSPACLSIRNSLFKKLQPPSLDPELSYKARVTFLQTENSCFLTNKRIRLSWSNHTDYSRSNVLYVASRKIRSILGKFSIQEMLNLGRFGPGSTFSCSGDDVSLSRKFSATDVTFEFQKLASALLAEYPAWTSTLIDSDGFCCPFLVGVPGGRHSTVPKDSKTDRNIIVEPTINSFFQQSLGRMIRARLLKKAGVDLNDQTVNRKLALLGSMTDDLATVDLSNASDLLSTNLVKDLLPEDWFLWLDATRSHRCLIDGKWIKLEKFSSMGNGFTFDLESLIFYALAFAVVEVEGFNPFWVNVFGDDIVVPSGVASPLDSVFTDCGFSINLEKSFFSGPFRESCGHDYYLGKNIRGVYIKKLMCRFDCMKTYNRVRQWTQEHGDHYFQNLRNLLRGLCRQFPLVPAHLGDVGLHSFLDECCPPIARDGWEGYRVTVMVPRFLKRTRSDRFLNLSRLFTAGCQDWAGRHNEEHLRREPCGYSSLVITTHWEGTTD